MANIPPYNLKRMHKLLSDRGFYEGFDCISYGYGNVIKRAIRSETPDTLVPAE